MTRNEDGSPILSNLQEALKDSWRQFTERGWRFAKLAAEAEMAQAHTAWGYKSLGHWARAELGFVSKSTFYRYVQAGRFLSQRENGNRQRWMAQPVFNVIEVLPIAKAEPEKALTILENQPSQAAIRAEIRIARAKTHHYKAGGYKTIAAAISDETVHEWRRLMNRVRNQLGVGGVEYPTDDEVLEMLIANALLDYPLPAEEEAAVDAGDARCHYPLGGQVECGSYAHLQRHHVLPRSHQGHEGPLVYLCARHHEAVTRGDDGMGWRELAVKLGYAEIADAP